MIATALEYAHIARVPPKRRYLPTSPHGVTTQNNNIDIFTAVRTSQILLLSDISGSNGGEYPQI
jgi:hypothetical protein